jgi:CBS domain-containing protein
METLVAALTELGRISGVALSSPLYAVVSALHILGIALLVGAILLVDLRFAGLLKRLDPDAMALMRRVARIGAALAVATGILLVSARPAEYLANRVFLAKMAVVALALANALAFEIMARRTPLAALVDTPYARAAAILSLGLWPVVIGLGRWIAFV